MDKGLLSSLQNHQQRIFLSVSSNLSVQMWRKEKTCTDFKDLVCCLYFFKKKTEQIIIRAKTKLQKNP